MKKMMKGKRKKKMLAGRNWVTGEMGNGTGIRILERETERINWEDKPMKEEERAK